MDDVGDGERSVEFRQDRKIFPNEGQVVAASLDRHIGIVHVMPGHLYDLVRPRE